MLLLVDVGNSTVKWVITPLHSYKPLNKGILKPDRLGELKRFKDIPYRVVASVRPSLNPQLEKILEGPIFVTNKDCLQIIGSEYKTPHTLGVDRLLNAIGGLDYSDSFCIVSFGTATVVDAVVDKTFLGGAIFLGIEKHLKCLSSNAEQLPLEKPTIPLKVLGKSTAECLTVGSFYSQIFTVKGLIDEYRELYGIKTFILTGGTSEYFRDFFKGGILDRDLLFKGLFKVFKKVYRKD
jgi:type III pantothenate kinase